MGPITPFVTYISKGPITYEREYLRATEARRSGQGGAEGQVRRLLHGSLAFPVGGGAGRCRGSRGTRPAHFPAEKGKRGKEGEGKGGKKWAKR